LNRYDIIKVLIFLPLIFVLLFIGYYVAAQNPASSSQINVSSYYDKVIMYLNKTSSCIEAMSPALDVDYHDMVRINNIYHEEYNRMLNRPGVFYDDLMTLEAYMNVSDTTIIIYNTSLDLPMIDGGMKESMVKLRNMDVSGSISVYESIRQKLFRAINSLELSLNILNNTKYMDYMWFDHQQQINRSIDVIRGKLDMLKEYRDLMELLKYYQYNLTNPSNQSLIHVAEKIMEEIDLNKLGPYAEDLAIFLSKLVSQQKPLENTESTRTYTGGPYGGYSGSLEDD